MGFVAFPMPEIFPNHYWLFHSLWHVFLAAGYYELYALIEQDRLTAQKTPAKQESRNHAARHAKRQLAIADLPKGASNSSLDSTCELASSQDQMHFQVCCACSL